LNRRIAAHVREFPPIGIPQDKLTKALEAVEAPCSFREQNLLRMIFDQDFEEPEAKSAALIAEIERIGLEPFQAPEPLPPITHDDVHLICWMAIETAK
jgi:hypothetical protein